MYNCQQHAMKKCFWVLLKSKVFMVLKVFWVRVSCAWMSIKAQVSSTTCLWDIHRKMLSALRSDVKSTCKFLKYVWKCGTKGLYDALFTMMVSKTAMNLLYQNRRLQWRFSVILCHAIHGDNPCQMCIE